MVLLFLISSNKSNCPPIILHFINSIDQFFIMNENPMMTSCPFVWNTDKSATLFLFIILESVKGIKKVFKSNCYLLRITNFNFLVPYFCSRHYRNSCFTHVGKVISEIIKCIIHIRKNLHLHLFLQISDLWAGSNFFRSMNIYLKTIYSWFKKYNCLSNFNQIIS